MSSQARSVAAALQQAGVTIPAVPKPAGAYVGAIRTGNLVVTSGQLPWIDGVLLHTGRIGAEVSEGEGKACARVCAINALAQFQAAIGDLESIVRIVRVEGFVHCAPGYRGHPRVLDGASHFFNEIFGDRGIHTRVALGITEMPFDAPVQLVVWAEVA
jgi:enamine deaminase RidA (YjgF/YER057c/UK114 family)